jgi:hypothetical protein
MGDSGISLLIRFFHIPDIGLYIAGISLGAGLLIILAMMWKFVALRRSLTPVINVLELVADYDSSAVQFRKNSKKLLAIRSLDHTEISECHLLRRYFLRTTLFTSPERRKQVVTDS